MNSDDLPKIKVGTFEFAMADGQPPDIVALFNPATKRWEISDKQGNATGVAVNRLIALDLYGQESERDAVILLAREMLIPVMLAREAAFKAGVSAGRQRLSNEIKGLMALLLSPLVDVLNAPKIENE